MGTNVAVILAVPKYDSLLPLPSCASDAKVVHTLLHKSGKFSDVLLLDKPETRAVIMGRLSDFFRKYESEPVDDFLFYYTGHGAVIDEEFRYLLSDFDKINQMARRFPTQTSTIWRVPSNHRFTVRWSTPASPASLTSRMTMLLGVSSRRGKQNSNHATSSSHHSTTRVPSQTTSFRTSRADSSRPSSRTQRLQSVITISPAR